ncbi:serine hydrolase [Kineococcus sp. NPDC059986]|uniref:serine hydrolase n=1 Tax=Kineococcus sp. NPDC059986 TaxID=3155538 RepID=UPI00344B2695
MEVSRRSFTAAGAGTGVLAAFGWPPDEVTSWAVDLLSGRVTGHRPDLPRPVLTLPAGPALAALLRERGTGVLDERVRYDAGDLVGSTPVCGWHLQTGMTVAGLGDAALRRGDATATNLLVLRAGGAAAVTGFCRAIGDRRTRIDRRAPDSCTAAPWDPRDTTTTRALALGWGTLLLGEALPPAARYRFADLLPTVRVRGGWSLTHAVASGRYGTAALVGTARRGRRGVLVAATVRAGQPAQDGSRAAVTRVVETLLRGLDSTW